MTHSQPHILITRATDQYRPFAQACQQLGLQVSHLPCLLIEATDTGIKNENVPADPNRYLQHDLHSVFDCVLFTSVNAVTHAHRQRPLPWSDVAVHAIGASTQKALQQLGQAVSLKPCAPYNSESYLTQIQHHSPARMLIIKGVGGRGLIQAQLQQWHWQVTTFDVYQRRKPVTDSSVIQEIFTDPAPDIVSVTSNEVLQNLILIAADYLPALRQLPLVVNSQRCADYALQSGFTQRLYIANPAGDEGQLVQLQRWIDDRGQR